MQELITESFGALEIDSVWFELHEDGNVQIDGNTATVDVNLFMNEGDTKAFRVSLELEEL